MQPSKRKGNRVEREVGNLHKALGVEASRVPLSGSAGGAFSGDVRVVIDGHELTGEVKARRGGAGFKTLERWLGDNDLLFLRRDRQTPLVVLPWTTYSRLLEGFIREE